MSTLTRLPLGRTLRWSSTSTIHARTWSLQTNVNMALRSQAPRGDPLLRISPQMGLRRLLNWQPRWARAATGIMFTSHALMGAAGATLYPAPLVNEVLRAVRDTHEADNPSEDTPEAELPAAMTGACCLHVGAPCVSSLIPAADVAAENNNLTTHVRMHEDSVRPLHRVDRFKTAYTDGFTNEPPPGEWIRGAIHDESDDFNKKGWTIVPCKRLVVGRNRN